MNDKLSILGSTGSIGTQALVVAEKLGLKITEYLYGSEKAAELKKATCGR